MPAARAAGAALGVACQMGILEVKSSRFQTSKRRLDSPTLAIERQHLRKVGSVG